MSVETRPYIGIVSQTEVGLPRIKSALANLEGNPEKTQHDSMDSYMLLSSLRDLGKVRSNLGLGVYASANENFAAAHFTRDSVKVSGDTLDIRPQIAVETILTGVELQATMANDETDATAGEYHHEHRSQAIIDELDLKPELRESTEEILKRLSTMWGGNGEEVTYYGGKDTTPELIRLAMQYQMTYPQHALLDRTPHDFVAEGRRVQKPERQNISVRESLVTALQGVVTELVSSDLTLREFEIRNPLGIKNKFWKDSATSLLFENGQQVNHAAPIAEVGLQGITYDALKMSARLLRPQDIEQVISKEDLEIILRKEMTRLVFSNTEIAEFFEKLKANEINGLDIVAKVIQRQTLRQFWMEDSENSERGFFGSAIDRDPNDTTNKTYRLVDTISSNAGLLLKSTIFDDLPETEKQKYVANIARVLTSDEFLTDVGVRGRAVPYINLVPFYDYHGAGTSWIKETDDIAQGFRHQGLHRLADQLEFRMINAVNIAGSHYEFFYVDADGKVNYDPHGKRSNTCNVTTEKRIIYGTNIPESDQAWSISSIIRAKREQGKRLKQTTEPLSWQYAFEEELLSTLPSIKLLKTNKEIQEAVPVHCIFSINTEEGRKCEQKYNQTWWDNAGKVT